MRCQKSFVLALVACAGCAPLPYTQASSQALYEQDMYGPPYPYYPADGYYAGPYPWAFPFGFAGGAVVLFGAHHHDHDHYHDHDHDHDHGFGGHFVHGEAHSGGQGGSHGGWGHHP